MMSTDLDMSSDLPLPLHLPPAEPSKPSSAAPSRTAAREFYLCPELRQHLLGLCDKHTLTNFIRAERKCVFDVATVLYKEMSYIWVRSHMAVTTPRQKTYCEAVEVIDCRGAKFKIAPAMLKKTDFVCTNPKKRTAQIAEYLAAYNTSVFNLVVPPMRKKCPRLRSMLFGSQTGSTYGGDSWVVHFDPAQTPLEDGKRSQGRAAASGGRIDFRRMMHLMSVGEPPSVVKPPSPPSAAYSLRCRFDLHISAYRAEPSLQARWIKALREGNCFAALYKSLHCEELPLSFDDLVAIYGRQDSAGYAERLENVSVACIVPWCVRDMEDFARVASTSLTTLELFDSFFGAKVLPNASYQDLPAIIEIVRNHLPNLSTLHLALQGLCEADAVCLPALDERVLLESGSVADLRIFTTPQGGTNPDHGRRQRIPLFNAIRLASRMCTKEAKISLDSSAFSESSSRKKEQREFLHFLWLQSPQSRALLAKIDFTTLGIKRLQEVPYLGFHPDGRPKGLWEKKMGELKLSSRIRHLRDEVHPQSHSIDRALRECGRAAKDIEALSTRATTVELYSKVNALQKRLEQAQSLLKPRQYISGSYKVDSDVWDFAVLLKQTAPALARERDLDSDLDSDLSDGVVGDSETDVDSDEW